VPAGLADLLEDMEQDLLVHMQKEENILFPLLLAGGNPFDGQPIAMMRAEHVQHGATLERLSERTHNATPPEGACNTWRALYAGVAQLQEDLMNHIHLENNVLFARFDAPQAPAKHSPCCGSCGG
jgi:regulator of cell morphogenesis and NO signaling